MKTKTVKPRQADYDIDQLIQIGWDEIERYGKNQTSKNRKIKSLATASLHYHYR